MSTELSLVLARVRSPMGMLLAVSDVEGRLAALEYDSHDERMHTLLARHHGAGRYTLAEGPPPAPVTRALDAFFAGELRALEALGVCTGGTAFEQVVWAALRRIPAGTTTTYGALAATLGKPAASRAVGRANGQNPVAIVIPCHRVIGADGSLTGYAGGVERKRWLLDHEGSGGGQLTLM